MAMLVLLSFEDDEQALRFVDNVLEDRILQGDDEDRLPTKVQALYKQPTQFHPAFETHGAGKTGSGWRRGEKWGWQICSTCGKPSDMAWDSILTSQSSFGYNILGRYFEGLVPEEKCRACGDTYPRPAEHHHTRAQCKAKLAEKTCSYEKRWTDEVGDVWVCTVHKNNSRHHRDHTQDLSNDHSACLTVDPYPKEAVDAEAESVPDRAPEVLPAGLPGDVQAPPMGQDQS